MNKYKEEFYQKLDDTITSVYTMSETGVSEVLNQPFKFGTVRGVRVAKYIQEIQDFGYKAFKHAEIKEHEGE